MCVCDCVNPQGQSKESGGQISAGGMALHRNRSSPPSVPGCVHVYLYRSVSEGAGVWWGQVRPCLWELGKGRREEQEQEQEQGGEVVVVVVEGTLHQVLHPR